MVVLWLSLAGVVLVAGILCLMSDRKARRRGQRPNLIGRHSRLGGGSYHGDAGAAADLTHNQILVSVGVARRCSELIASAGQIRQAARAT